MGKDTIYRQAAIAYSISGMTREIDGEKWIRVSEVRESIKTLPSAQPEREKGKWVEQTGAVGYECSVCHRWLDVFQGSADMNFCPNCGAEMRGEQDEL